MFTKNIKLKAFWWCFGLMVAPWTSPLKVIVKQETALPCSKGIKGNEDHPLYALSCEDSGKKLTVIEELVSLRQGQSALQIIDSMSFRK